MSPEQNAREAVRRDARLACNEHFTNRLTGQTDATHHGSGLKSFHTFLSVSALVSLKLFSLIWSSFSSKTLVVFVTMLHHNTNTDSLLCHDSRLGTWVGWLWGQHAYLTWSITMALGHTNTHWHKRTSKSPAYALDCVYLQYGCTGQWLRPSKWNCLHWFKTC